MIRSLILNWKTYTMEAVCLGLFMVSASLFATILEYPGSVIHQLIPDEFTRLCIMGAAMGLTATAIIYSPMGKLSGAHMNPAISFSFVRLGKMTKRDAFFYVIFQCVGGMLAVSIMAVILNESFFDPHVNFVVTVPGKPGIITAFSYEVVMSFCMMLMVLLTTNHPRIARYTGVIAGVLVACFVVISGPVSGFSINPARTIASAVPAMVYSSIWIYLSAPFIGMFAAAELFRLLNRKAICAKMDHAAAYSCIFKCGYCKHES